MIIFNNKYVEFNFDKENSIFRMNWKTKTENASQEDFKAWNREVVENIELYNPKNVLSDNRNYLFIIVPELQEWSVVNIFVPMQKAGVRKLAMLLSPELFAQVSLEQFADEYGKDDIVVKYFNDENQATNWLSE